MSMASQSIRRAHFISHILVLCALLPTAIAFAGSIRIDAGKKEAAETGANWELARQWDPMTIYQMLGSTVAQPNWVEGSDLVWFRYITAEGRHYWLVDPERRTKQALFDRGKLASEITRHIGEPSDSTTLDLAELTVDPDGGHFHFEIGAARYRYDRAAELLAFADSLPTGSESAHPYWTASPDGELGVYIRGNNLYLCNPVDPEGSETQISSDGIRGLSWGLMEEFYKDDDTVARPAAVTWSPDSRGFCIPRSDFRKVEELWLVENLSLPRPTLRTFPCPMPGETTPEQTLWLFDRETASLGQIDVARWPDQILDDLFITPLWWSEDSCTLFLARRSRDYSKVDLCTYDVETSDLRLVIEERMPTQVYLKDLELLPERGELLWWSMRDGWGHLYRYTNDGTLLNPVRAGDFNVDRIVHIDSVEGVVFFMANGRENGRNPYYRHLYRVNLDGSDLRLLTPEDAEHDVQMSPDGHRFIDSISRVDRPTEIVLRDALGNKLLDLETADTSQLMEAGWQAPEVFKAMSADGVTEQWGVLYKPFDFDPTRKYPIVTRVYPGRFGEFIPRSFWPVNAETFLAQLGCIVVRFGNRGATFERGQAYREHGTDDFRDYGLADKRAVIEELAERHDWIDGERVGIYGSSSGGYMTLSAMLVDNDFYKVGVAMAGPQDPQAYYNYWVERYAGVELVADSSGGSHWEPAAAKSNVEIADSLRGKLLLIHGAQDAVVHPVHLMRTADALIKAGKRFDMFVVPGAGHSLGSWQYLNGLIWDYFAEHLIGGSRDSAEAVIAP